MARMEGASAGGCGEGGGEGYAGAGGARRTTVARAAGAGAARKQARNATEDCAAPQCGGVSKWNARRRAGVPDQPMRGSAPAAIDHELGVATAVHPDAGAVPAPVLAFDAARVGNLARDAYVAAAAGVDLAHAVVVALARATHADRLVPARTRAPVATAAVIVATTARPPALHAEHALAALVDPDAGAV